MTVWKKYSLGVVLVVLFLAAWAGMTWSGWMYFVGEQQDHHEIAQVFGSSGYIWRWGQDTFSNWQADFLGQAMAVILGAYLIFRGSEQSKDTDEEVERVVQDIERDVRGQEAATLASRQTQAQLYRGGVFHNYGLGILLVAGFLVSWALMTWMGWNLFASTATEHHQTATVFGSNGYIWEWARQTFQNWQADALGHALIVILPAYLLYKGSASSREGMDRVKATLLRVRQALQVQQQGQPQAGSIVAESRPLQPAPGRRSPLRFWWLGVTSLAIFLVAWILQTWTGWRYFEMDQSWHHSTADVFSASGYIWLWGEDTFSNWQSDLLWTGILVLMGAYLIYQGSSESKDSDERIEQLADSIETQVRGQQAARRAESRTDRAISWGGVWRNSGLAYSMIVAGIITWGLMTWMGWQYFASTQHEHGATAEWFGSSGYIWSWARLTLENWQSDLLGNLVTVVLAAYLLYRGSGMSRESDDEIEQALQRIQEALASKQSGTLQAQPLRQADSRPPDDSRS